MSNQKETSFLRKKKKETVPKKKEKGERER